MAAVTLGALNDDDLASLLADGAGSLLTAAASEGLLTGPSLGALGDAVSHRWITAVLEQWRPADGLLSEEGVADPSRLARHRVWIVDPLDGTREYSEGRADWAVHIALVEDGEPVLGVVALPGLGMTMSSADKGAIPGPPPGRMRIAVSRTRPPEVASSVADRLDAELVPMGSAGFKAMAVVRGEVHAYLHAGGQYEWDSAAPVAVALGRGLHASRLDGSPLRYNKPDPMLPDLMVCQPAVAAQLLGALSEAGWAA